MKKKKKERKSGILMPISALPTPFGIGGFSKEAYDFVDFLKKSGQRMWQILPIGPTGYGDSPYQSFSTYAGNPYYIDLQEFIDLGFLTKKECEKAPHGTHPEYVDYEKIYKSRFKLLKKAFEGACKADFLENQDYISFKKENKDWLEDYALYMAVKSGFKNQCWVKWDEDIRLRKKSAIKEYREKYKTEVEFYCFQQYYFAKQWKNLKKYANDLGIQIVGDLPIYVAFDSADTWANPELFQLDKENMPIGVAGCPPDAFAVTGQLWGNPLYAWDYHEKTGFAWWIRRMSRCYDLYDIVRIDHFRGFESYWFVPYGDETAENGHWVKGPGLKLFETLNKALGEREVIAEDLGFLTKEVIKMVKKSGYPGMKVLQFGFDSDETNAYLPHNYPKNCIVYTGTHDNDTTVGWFKSQNSTTRQNFKNYTGIKNNKDVCFAMIRLALSSVAKLAVIPMQDYLELPEEARFNTPSTMGENWKWRMKEDALTDELAEKIYKMTKIYGRL